MYSCRINSLQAKAIGAFEDLTLNFQNKVLENKAEIHILTGKNGTGKSTILEMLVSSLKAQYLEKGLYDKIHFNVNDFKILVGVEYQPDKIEIEKGIILSFEHYTLNWTNQSTLFYKYNHNELLFQEYHKKVVDINAKSKGSLSFAFFAYSGYRRINQVQLGAIQELTNSPFEGCLDFNNSINPHLLIQWLANTITKKALAFSRNDLESVGKYAETIHRIENAISEITGDKIEFELLDNPLSVGININDLKLDFNALPDGLKSIVSWIADLLMRMDRIPWASDVNVFDRNFILFLDEIEVHLHPEWQRKVLPVVQKLFPNAQIFISTHSPFVVGSIDGAWIYKLKKEGNYSVLDGNPILSEDGKSFQYILDETFDIQTQFGIEVEKKLKEFYDYKVKIIKGELAISNEEFSKLSNDLSEQSIELESIVGMELKQIERIANNKMINQG